jgi:hypothetical protein
VDSRNALDRRFGVSLHERSVGKTLTKLGYGRLSVRPRRRATTPHATREKVSATPARPRRGAGLNRPDARDRAWRLPVMPASVSRAP